MRVLVVDDQELNRTLLQFLLQDEGYEVVIATNGEEALQRFDDHEIDLVFLAIGFFGKIKIRPALSKISQFPKNIEIDP